MARKKVLIVEDEEEITIILEDILLLNDTDAIIAYNGNNALKALDEEPVNLVISDLNLPDVHGLDLYKAIIKKYPSLENRFLFISGYSLDEAMELFLAKTDNRYIQKPFPITEVQQVLQDYL